MVNTLCFCFKCRDHAGSHCSCPPCYCAGCPHAVKQCKACGNSGWVLASTGRAEDGPDPCPDCTTRCVVCGKEGLANHRPPLCKKCRHEASASETLKRLPVLSDPAISEAIKRILQEEFALDDEEYIHVPPLAKAGDWSPKGVECGECGVRFNYWKIYRLSCQSRRCPLQGRNRSAAGLLFTP